MGSNLSEISYKDLKNIINRIVEDQNINISDLGVTEEKFNGDEPCFDMALIKFLAGSNTGSKGSVSSHQSSILLTGEQTAIFPVLKRQEYYGNPIGKMRVIKVPIDIMSNNLEYLKGNSTDNTNRSIHTWITTNETTGNRVEAGCIAIDGEDYNDFHSSLSADSVMIILKLMADIKYVVLAIKNDDIAKYFEGIEIEENIKYYMYDIGKITKNKSEKVTYIEPSTLEDINEDITFNMLVAGAPGTGKSKLIDDKRKKYFGKNYERVTFYPDYTYGQFVGMYKPYMNKSKIEYKFVPGPFLRLLVDALNNKDKNYLLIVEEINRGNAASIFGDMFQAIDRDENGNGEYSVSISEDMKQYMDTELTEKVDSICLPNNLYIWATMNTSDQGIYPLDSAFKRRFDGYKFMNIDENESVIENYEVNIKCNSIKKIKWNTFRKAINSYLSSLNIAEDKMIGPFFIKPDVLSNDGKFQKAFSDKLLMYLIEDVLKHRKGKLFASSSVSEILSGYENSGDVFTAEFMKHLEDGIQNE